VYGAWECCQTYSDVPMVLNLHTGAITPQFHMVFDDLFSTVPSIGGKSEHVEENLPNLW